MAERLGFVYLDTGAMYRAVGLLADGGRAWPWTTRRPSWAWRAAAGLRFDGDGRLFAGDRDLGDAIRTLEMGDAASRVSALPGVRRLLVGAAAPPGARPPTS